MAEFEGCERSLGGLGVAGEVAPELFLDLGLLALEVGCFLLEGRLVDGPQEEGVQEALLHVGQFRLSLPERLLALLLDQSRVREALVDAPPEPLGDLLRHSNLLEVFLDRGLQVLLLPSNGGMVLRRGVVRAAVVEVLPNASVQELPADLLARHPVAAMPAPEESARHRVGLMHHPTVSAMEDVLAGLEELPGEEKAMLAREVRSVSDQLARIEPVVQDVRERARGELRLVRPVGEPFLLHRFAHLREGIVARGEEFEEPDERLRFGGVGHDRFRLVVGVHVAVWGAPGMPALADPLIDPLQDLGAQVVRVVLGDGGHDVEGKGPRRPRPELVLDEGQLDAAFVFELLEANGVPHVSADPVELVGQDRVDLLLPGVPSHPLEHLVEGQPFLASLGRLRYGELPRNRPAVLRGPIPAGPELGVDGIALSLLAGGHPGPDDDIHGCFPSKAEAARPNTSATRRAFASISTASSFGTGRPRNRPQTSWV